MLQLNNIKPISLCLITGKIVKKTIPKKILDPEKIGVTSSEILEEISRQKSIAISFSKMTDGRAYSLAAKIKEMAEDVELHATGKINQEICYFLKRSGFKIAHFDVIPDKSTFVKGRKELALILTPFNEHYQAGKDNSKGIY